MSRRLSSRARRHLVGGSFAVAMVAAAAGCGDFQLAEFTRATTTTVEVESTLTTLVDEELEAGSQTTITIRPARWVILEGESLSSIAAKFDVDAAAIMEINGITDPNAVRAGQQIIIPDPDAPIPPPWQQRDDFGR